MSSFSVSSFFLETISISRNVPIQGSPDCFNRVLTYLGDNLGTPVPSGFFSINAPKPETKLSFMDYKKRIKRNVSMWLKCGKITLLTKYLKIQLTKTSDVSPLRFDWSRATNSIGSHRILCATLNIRVDDLFRTFLVTLYFQIAYMIGWSYTVTHWEAAVLKKKLERP